MTNGNDLLNATTSGGFNPVTGDTWISGGGLTKREYFAALAMQGCLASPAIQGRAFAYDNIADEAVHYADALIAALNKGAK